jgi:hypothetical protein
MWCRVRGITVLQVVIDPKEGLRSENGWLISTSDVNISERASAQNPATGGGWRGKRKEKGLRDIFDRRGGFHTFRYMLKERRALLACVTYLQME